DRAAFHSALDAVEQLQSPEKGKIRILGPTFSGSQATLVDALGANAPTSKAAGVIEKNGERQNAPARQFQIVTGSATSIQVKRLPRNVEFSATIIPDQALRAAALDYLVARNTPGVEKKPMRLSNVAFLVESNTGYGQIASAHTKELEITTIPFPLHVSDVLIEYQASRQSQSDGLPKLESLGGRVELPLTHDLDQSDRLRPSSPDWTAVRVDMLLRQITKTLREKDFRYVGIIATSTRDKLFLASLIRRSCP